MQGIVLKNQNGYFTVSGNDGNLLLCRSRGHLKRETDILVGDFVEYETNGETEGIIVKVYSRKNQLYRPPVANIDQIVLVSSIRTPDINPFLLDRMILLAENADMTPIICISKYDLAENESDRLCAEYKKAGYISLCTSLVTHKGVDELRAYLQGNVVAFSGPSGTGKSSLLNLLLKESYFKSGEVSKHTGRGKTTTRHAELVKFDGNSYLMDTPGYTFLEIERLNADDLAFLFKEFRPYIGNCYFNDCRHSSEPGCMVRKAVEEGMIEKRRYESYILILEELKNKKKYR